MDPHSNPSVMDTTTAHDTSAATTSPPDTLAGAGVGAEKSAGREAPSQHIARQGSGPGAGGGDARERGPVYGPHRPDSPPPQPRTDSDNESSRSASPGIPDDDEVLDARTITFKFVVQQAEYETQFKLVSDFFPLVGVPLAIMIFPGGNDASDHTEGFCSVYVTLNDTTKRPYDLSLYLDLKLSIVNRDPRFTVTKPTHHYFDSRSLTSWGFPKFMHWATIIDPSKGFLVDGQVTVVAEMRAMAGRALRWGYHSKYSAKQATGMVGLHNQGATCYMNSVLQTLFTTNALRRAVFQMPTEGDDAKTSVALALQRVFYQLQTSDDAVDTSDLTRSFGWTSADAFMQHDIQEFARVLIDNIEEKMKASPVAGFVAGLLSGTTNSYFRCVNVNFESSRQETFYDIQLNVRGSKTLYDAFRQYIEQETLDGDNKYNAEGHGLQVAKHGTIFRKLPPVLHLHLKRFEYSVEREDYVKINDRIEFYEEIDLSPYLETPPPTPATYVLHSVLVHSGWSQGGHYIVYIRPQPHGRWLKFDDERVTLATKQQALDDNFGCDDKVPASRFSRNAYMLVYVAKAQAHDLLRPCVLEDVPAPLRARFDKELEDAEREEKERKELANFVKIELFTDALLAARAKADFADVGLCGTPASLRRTAGVADLMREVEQLCGIPVAHQRLFPLIKKFHPPGKVPSISARVPLSADNTENLGDISYYVKTPTWRIFVEDTRDGHTDFAPRDHKLIFLKEYDGKTQTFAYLRHVVASTDGTIADLIRDFPPGSRVFLDHLKESREYDSTVDIGDLLNGVPLIVQRPTEGEAEDFLHYAGRIANQREVVLEPLPPPGTDFSFRFHDDAPKTNPNEISMALDARLSYEQVAQALAKRIKEDRWQHIQFTRHCPFLERPLSAMECAEDVDLEDMLSSEKRSTNKIYFEVLSLPVMELQEHKLRVNHLVHFDYATHTSTYMDLIVDRHAVVEDLLAAVSQALPQRPTRPLRLFKMRTTTTISRLCGPREPLSVLLRDTATTYAEFLRVEQVPEDQLSLSLDSVDAPSDRCIALVQHFSRDVYIKHSDPFFIVVYEGERVSELRQRLSTSLNVPIATLAKWRLGYMISWNFYQFEDDATLRLSDITATSSAFPVLALDHPDKNSKRQRIAEKALKIYN